MALSYAAFVDVGFLKAEGARALREHGADLRPAAAEVVQWLLSLVRESLFYATWLAESYIQTEDIDEAARQAAGALLRSRRVNSARAPRNESRCSAGASAPTATCGQSRSSRS